MIKIILFINGLFFGYLIGIIMGWFYGIAAIKNGSVIIRKSMDKNNKND